MTAMKRLSFLIIIVGFLPQFAAAQVSISEIMYNPKGADTGREWVEIFNDGASAIDLTGWKFNEGNTNHGLTAVRGGTNISAAGYAVIADDATKFLVDFPNFSGVLFDSSFSLNNTGETIAIKDNSLNIIDSVTYSADQGGNDNGDSLQKVKGVWLAASSTPGVAPAGSLINLGAEFSSGSGAKAEIGGGNSVWPEYVPPEKAPKIKMEIVAESRAIAGAAQRFEARVYGTKNEPITNARVTWNFGDGARGEGRFATHVFNYPGTYLIVADASSGEYVTTTHLTVSVGSNTLYISEVSPGATTTAWIEIANPGANAVDLSGWFLGSVGGNFIFPDNSILAPRSFAVFTSENTKLDIPMSGEVKLLYPNGKPADIFIYSGELGEGQTFQRADSKAIALKASPGAATKLQNVALHTDAPVQTAPATDPVAKAENSNDNARQLAAVATAAGNGKEWWIWFAVSAGLGLFGAATFLLMKHRVREESPTISKDAEEFKIEEI